MRSSPRIPIFLLFLREKSACQQTLFRLTRVRVPCIASSAQECHFRRDMMCFLFFATELPAQHGGRSLRKVQRWFCRELFARRIPAVSRLSMSSFSRFEQVSLSCKLYSDFCVCFQGYACVYLNLSVRSIGTFHGTSPLSSFLKE